MTKLVEGRKSTKFQIAARLRFLPEEQALSPTENTKPIADAWWLVHPTKGLVFYHSHKNLAAPQANPNVLISRRVNERYYPDFNFQVKYYPVVFIPVDKFGYYSIGD